MSRIPGTGQPYEYNHEPTRSWDLFCSLEDLGLDAQCAKISDLGLHTITIASQLVRWADNPSRTLYLWGSPGSGKTYAGLALMRRVYQRCPLAWMRYLDATRITDLGKARGSSYLQETYGDCSLLMVDDLGVALPADWEQRYVYDLFERRCQKKKLPTIVTSNLSKKELAKVVGERVTSRLVGLEIELMVGDVRR